MFVKLCSKVQHWKWENKCIETSEFAAIVLSDALTVYAMDKCTGYNCVYICCFKNKSDNSNSKTHSRPKQKRNKKKPIELNRPTKIRANFMSQCSMSD